jgi:Sulfotransferase family
LTADTLPQSPPIFVLCVGRTGSTLLRLLLDAHPEIACPPETDLGPLISSLEQHVRAAFETDVGTQDEVAAELAAQIVERTVGAYTRERGKKRWAEKSLTSVDHAVALRRVFPDAQFICLVRECRDTIASLLEASPLGMADLIPYSHMHPGNQVAACAQMWADKVGAMLAFERANPGACLRVRYEDMITKPKDTLSGICAFLGVEWSEELLSADRWLDLSKRSERGDSKIWYTSSFDPSSIGRGLSLPGALIPHALGNRIDRIHAELGYPMLGELRAVVSDHDADRAESEASGFAILRDLFEGRVARRLVSFELGADAPPEPILRIRVLPGGRPWIIDFGSRTVAQSADESFCCTALADTDTLLDIANGANPGVALKQMRLRFVVRNGRGSAAKAWYRDALIGVLAPQRS